MISGWPTIQALVFIPTSMRLPIQKTLQVNLRNQAMTQASTRCAMGSTFEAMLGTRSMSITHLEPSKARHKNRLHGRFSGMTLFSR